MSREITYQEYNTPDTSNFLYHMEVIELDPNESIDFALKNWKIYYDQELRHGYIPWEAIQFDYDDEIITVSNNYFEKEYYKVDPTHIHYDDIDMGAENPGEWETYIKNVWLATEYLDNDRKFQYPICCHWNPRILSSPVHPGGARNKVIRAFGHPGMMVETFYFNTLGYDSSWWRKMKPVDLESWKEKDISIGLSPDHGTLIPHVMQKTHSIKVGKKEHQRRFYLECKKGIYILSNNYELLPPWVKKFNNKNSPTTMKIHFKDPNKPLSMQEQIQIRILIGCVRNYQGENYSIKIKRKKPK